jgi:endonuclease/exonuclease/phosphatase (EEP) superfamily protein YafD
VVVVLVVVAINFLLPQRSGPIDVTEAWEQIMVASAFLAAFLAMPYVLLHRSWAGYLVVVALIVTSVARYGTQWISLPETGQAKLSVAAWNVEGGADAGSRVIEGIDGIDVDVLGLEEFQPAMENALTTNRTIGLTYPYHVFAPSGDAVGVALLSRWPILEQQAWHHPSYIRAVVQPPTFDEVVVYVVHPVPPQGTGPGPLPLSFDTTQRTDDQKMIRAAIDSDLAADRSVVVMGDLNTTEREPAYADFTAGLNDAHLDAGIGPGLTWRPDELKSLPFGLFRIDYILSSPDLMANQTAVKCTALSDHCMVAAAFP